jgi:phospholipid/cholesterol/gamma-HCH transport system substrate-binding protein
VRAIRAHIGDFAAILGLLVIALGVSYVILQNQRLRIPLLEEKPFQLEGVFTTGQAVTPGQGQTIRVSGVRVGDISKVRLEDGRAIITMDLDQKYKGLVETNWTGLLRPKTGLKDMFIELTPGPEPAPPAEEGWRMPLSNTLPDVNPDEFLSALDADTRDYLRLLLHGARGGLEGRANDLSMVLRRFEPTYRDIAAVSSEVAKRKDDLERLVHSLDDLYTQLGRSDDDLAELVGASAETFEAFAQERVNVAATVRELDPTLSVTTDALGRVERFAEVLAPAADEIRPAVRALRSANAATLPFAREAVPLLRADIRPFVREARPLLRDLEPAAHDLVEADPGLKGTVRALNGLFNLLGYNENGAEGPTVVGRDEGYLFQLAWLAHQSIQLFGGQDGNGVFRPLILGGTCDTFQASANTVPGLANLLGLVGALSDPRVCGGNQP